MCNFRGKDPNLFSHFFLVNRLNVDSLILLVGTLHSTLPHFDESLATCKYLSMIRENTQMLKTLGRIPDLGFYLDEDMDAGIVVSCDSDWCLCGCSDIAEMTWRASLSLSFICLFFDVFITLSPSYLFIVFSALAYDLH